MAELVVLDTHAWIWWADESPSLSEAARKEIEGAGAVGVSAMSCWEVAMLEAKGRIALRDGSRAWTRAALAQPGVVALAVDPQTAVDAAQLGADGEFPDDPADRFIYAAARANGATLVTADRGIRAYDPRGTIW